MFDQRSKEQTKAAPDPLPGLAVEGFDLPDNLMIAGAVLQADGNVLLPGLTADIEHEES